MAKRVGAHVVFRPIAGPVLDDRLDEREPNPYEALEGEQEAAQRAADEHAQRESLFREIRRDVLKERADREDPAARATYITSILFHDHVVGASSVGIPCTLASEEELRTVVRGRKIRGGLDIVVEGNCRNIPREGRTVTAVFFGMKSYAGVYEEGVDPKWQRCSLPGEAHVLKEYGGRFCITIRPQFDFYCRSVKFSVV